MRIAEWIQATIAPPIVDIYAVAREYDRSGQPLINMGQGIPDMMPPAPCLAALADRLADPALHRYGPDQGLPELREALAADYQRRLGVRLDPDREIIITAGANHGFVLALLALVQPGERVVLGAPYYFNHLMALQLLGMTGVEWPLTVQGDRFVLDLDGLAPRLAAGAAGVVCVNPNNPTGAVFGAEDIGGVVAACVRRGVPLFYDEVYSLIAFGEEPAGHPYGFAGGREHTIVLGSFSKLFGMTGWRVGYIIAPPPVVEQMMKAQDTTVICAPVAGQALAAECLRRCPDYPVVYCRELRRRVHRLSAAVRDIPALAWREPAGALFTMLPYRHPEPSRQLAARLVREAGVMAIPGAAFGASGEGHLRISFGFSDEATIAEAGRRLARFFTGDRNRSGRSRTVAPGAGVRTAGVRTAGDPGADGTPGGADPC
ncbi:MAG TPA: pyridoxal phosphate-dependent aminotransferase [Acidobacteriota bacterium]|nr:pyridoxal phosphate-dependent aminotransferase [Acidobacteriota bacterium]